VVKVWRMTCKNGGKKKESATSIDGHEPELKAAYAIFHRGVGL